MLYPTNLVLQVDEMNIAHEINERDSFFLTVCAVFWCPTFIRLRRRKQIMVSHFTSALVVVGVRRSHLATAFCCGGVEWLAGWLASWLAAGWLAGCWLLQGWLGARVALEMAAQVASARSTLEMPLRRARNGCSSLLRVLLF